MPTYVIDTTTYRKDTHLPLGQGYSMRPVGVDPTSIVIHTTNSPKKNTDFADEAAYLQKSHEVSAHFLNGKAGQIAQILHPHLCAWHAGGKQQDGSWTAQPAFDNTHSIGIESHVSQGETWTIVQRDSLTWLVQYLMGLYRIPVVMIETHRKIALPGPNMRKHDPEAWPDASFYAWRAQLVAAPALPPTPLPTPPTRYTVKGLPVYQAANHQGALWGYLQAGQTVEIDNPANGHIAKVDGKPAAIGFVDVAGLEAL